MDQSSTEAVSPAGLVAVTVILPGVAVVRRRLTEPNRAGPARWAGPRMDQRRGPGWLAVRTAKPVRLAGRGPGETARRRAPGWGGGWAGGGAGSLTRRRGVVRPAGARMARRFSAWRGTVNS